MLRLLPLPLGDGFRLLHEYFHHNRRYFYVHNFFVVCCRFPCLLLHVACRRVANTHSYTGKKIMSKFKFKIEEYIPQNIVFKWRLYAEQILLIGINIPNYDKIKLFLSQIFRSPKSEIAQLLIPFGLILFCTFFLCTYVQQLGLHIELKVLALAVDLLAMQISSCACLLPHAASYRLCFDGQSTRSTTAKILLVAEKYTYYAKQPSIRLGQKGRVGSDQRRHSTLKLQRKQHLERHSKTRLLISASFVLVNWFFVNFYELQREKYNNKKKRRVRLF